MTPRGNYSALFKAKAALEAISGNKRLAELVGKHDMHPNQITTWKSQQPEHVSEVFGANKTTCGRQQAAHQGAVRGDWRAHYRPRFIIQCARVLPRSERTGMITRDTELPVIYQCVPLNLFWSSVYYMPRLLSEPDLGCMWRLDELHLEHPLLGARKLTALLRWKEHGVKRRHVSTLTRPMGIKRRNTAGRAPAYLTECMRCTPIYSATFIEQANQVWSSDIT